MASIGRGKCWKKQSHEIWVHLEHPPRNHERSSTRGGSPNHPPCRIGLKVHTSKLSDFLNFQSLQWRMTKPQSMYDQEQIHNLNSIKFSFWNLHRCVHLQTGKMMIQIQYCPNSKNHRQNPQEKSCDEFLDIFGTLRNHALSKFAQPFGIIDFVRKI